MDARLRSLLRKFYQDPESVDYEEIFTVNARSGRSGALIIAPCVTKVEEKFYGELRHTLRLMLSTPLQCKKQCYCSMSDLMMTGCSCGASEALIKNFIEIGDVSAGSTDEFEEEGLRGPPFYFNCFEILTRTSISPVNAEEAHEIFKTVFCLRSFQDFETKIHPEYPGSDPLPEEIVDLIWFSRSRGPYPTLKEFVQSIENHLIDLCQNLLNWEFFDLDESFQSIKQVIVLNHLFGKEHLLNQ